jgi:hypothetical protein
MAIERQHLAEPKARFSTKQHDEIAVFVSPGRFHEPLERVDVVKPSLMSSTRARA